MVRFLNFVAMFLLLQLMSRKTSSLVNYGRKVLCTHSSTYFSSTDSSEFSSLLTANDLSSLSVAQLKNMTKTLGGKTTGNMRKYQLVDLCLQLTENKANKTVQSEKEVKQSGIVNATLANASSSLHISPKVKYLKKLPPITDNCQLSSSSSTSFSYSEATKDFSNSKVFSIDSKFPSGINRANRFQHLHSADMDVTFLGTASCTPSISRGVTSIALRCRSGLWLFDCGESTQLQLQKSHLKPSKINKIFLTHLHGDHSFGLPGVLCMLGQSTQDERGKALINGDVMDALEIYGPEGTRDFVRASMSLTHTRAAIPHKIHELKNVPFLHSAYVSFKQRNGIESNVRTQFSSAYGERDGGRNIFPNEKGVYSLFEDDEFEVFAAPMQHTVPCVGFVIKEKNRVGKLNIDLAQTAVEKNKVRLLAKIVYFLKS